VLLGTEVRKNKRISKSVVLPHDGNRLGNVLDYRGRQRKKHIATISRNVTMSS
jgi:hypothetical protein